MKFLEKSILADKMLKPFLEIFTILYIVSLYVFAGGHEHWQQSYSNLLALFYIYLLCSYAYTHRQNLISVFLKLYIPFLVLCAFSCLWSWDKPYGIKLTLELCAMFVLSILMYNYFVTEKKIDLFLYGIYVGGICLMFGTVLYYGIPSYFKGLLAGDRMGHILGNLNDEGTHCTYSALIALYFVIYRKKYLNIIPFLCLFVYSVGTGSRKVFIILMLGVFLLIFLHKGWKYKVFSLASVLIVALLFFYLPIFKIVLERIKSALEYTQGGGDYSTNVRIGMLKASFAQFKKTPFFGIGLGSSHILLKKAVDFDSYSHCNYSELALLLGVVGFVFWYVHYLFTAKTFIRKTVSGDGLGILLLTFMITGLVVHIASVEYQERFQIILVMYYYVCQKLYEPTSV